MEENWKKSYPIRNRIKTEGAIRKIKLWLDNEEDSITESESEAEFSENESVDYERVSSSSGRIRKTGNSNKQNHLL